MCALVMPASHLSKRILDCCSLVGCLCLHLFRINNCFELFAMKALFLRVPLFLNNEWFDKELNSCFYICHCLMFLKMPDYPDKAHPPLGICTTILCVLNVSLIHH